jgi:hypothetical protein
MGKLKIISQLVRRIPRRIFIAEFKLGTVKLHGLTQAEAARMLDITTQNQYVNGKNSTNEANSKHA